MSNRVRSSLSRVHGPGFAERFYELLLHADPRIAALFQRTDFAKQKELFLHGLLSLLDYAEGTASGQMAMKRLGELHSRRRMNIAPDMFIIWVDCLIKTLAELDPQFSPQLEAEWRDAVGKGIDAMKRVY
jgi:hemoglobin-like flavoprotein